MDSLAYWSFGGLSAAAAALIYCKSDGGGGAKDASTEQLATYKVLQRKYFPAYFLALLGRINVTDAACNRFDLTTIFAACTVGDWLQGPYVYQLYSHYGYSEGSIAILFLTGFASSGVFGTFTGPMADKSVIQDRYILFSSI